MAFSNTLVQSSVTKSGTTIAGASTSVDPVGGFGKRAFDLSLTTTALIILLPLLVIVACLIWFTDRGNPIFGHTRIGGDGRPFKCLKFRSMVTNSGDVLATLLQNDAEAAREWADTQKLRKDPRVTSIGRVLRMTSLDELPQLFNVLLGQMSLVGPRPIVASEVERYGSDFAAYRSCRPGLTGLWQISGRSDCSYAERVGFDVSYANGWSLWRDTVIVARTVPAVLQRKGSC